MPDPRGLAEKVAKLWPHLDERAPRLFAASEAEADDLDPLRTHRDSRGGADRPKVIRLHLVHDEVMAA
ncbi:MAG TPA: hypothetical protein VFW04_01115 [Gemmatimonadaceae bacterium]|nr:hypothetical protein [Gemmatimonadaceae bacterium]